MGLTLLTERHAKQIAGMVSCYDRVIVQGTLPVFCYAEGMTAYLSKRRIRIFDFIQFAKPLTDAIKANAEAVAAANGIKIDYVRKKNFRKEDRVKAVLKERGTHPGLVWMFSALEPCTTYQPWHDKASGRTYLRSDDGKCLHYYFYFIDAELGLCYMRVPTWCPFRLQFYCNGHNWLARQLDCKKIGYTLLDNAFTAIEDWAAAQQLADRWDASRLHGKLDEFARDGIRLRIEFVKRALALAPRFHERAVGEQAEVRGDARLAETRDFLQFVDRELVLLEQGDDAQPRRVGQRPQ